MTRFAVLCGLAAVLGCAGCGPPGTVTAADKPKPEEAKAAAKKLAQDMGDATLKGDISVVLDYTYEPVLKGMGGKEAAEKKLKQVSSQLTAAGIAFKSYTVGDPGDLHTEGDNTFLVLPTSLEMTVPGGKLKTRNYILGVSTDAGKTWKFVEGSGIRDKKVRGQSAAQTACQVGAT